MSLVNFDYMATVSNPLVALTDENVSSVLGLDEALFDAERKREAYQNPQSYLDNRIAVLTELKDDAVTEYKNYMAGTKVPKGITDDDWKKLPMKKKQELALKVVYAEIQGRLEALEAFYPTSFKKTAKETLSLSALKKSLTG